MTSIYFISNIFKNIEYACVGFGETAFIPYYSLAGVKNRS